MRGHLRYALILSSVLWTSLGFSPRTRTPCAFRRFREELLRKDELRKPRTNSWHLRAETTTGSELSEITANLRQSLNSCLSDVTKICKVEVVHTASRRLGLVATEPISKGEVMLSIPFDDQFMFTAQIAREKVFQDVLPVSYEGWTGDSGMIALLILNEVARASDLGTPRPERKPHLQDLIRSWVLSLPSSQEFDHPFLWSEEAQEVLQASSTNKVYHKLDDIDEDVTWLGANVFGENRTRFPATVAWGGNTINCFNGQGFKWAVALAQSRSFFLDGRLRLIPLMDMCNHDDSAEEVRTGGGMFGSMKGSQLLAAKAYKPGDEVFCSYGPKSAADYLLEHGFCPDMCWKTSVSELTFEIDPKDRFYDDKIDILEYDTYDQAPMDPVQSFDVISAPGRDGEPDVAMMQFLRLAKLGSTDAFLLESIFRKDVWGFMSLPVSEKNELEVVNAIANACQSALDEIKDCPQGGPAVCSKLRESESRALTRTMEYLLREREALDLKEYYQERRLKDLGLDSDWSPEDDLGSDLGYGQTRSPGGADYDW